MELDSRDKIKKMISAGGKRWRKSEHDRIYFNDLAKLLKFEFGKAYYNTTSNGNNPYVLHSTLNGKSIDSKVAERLQNTLSSGKFWYDVKKNRFNTSYLYNRDYNIKQMLIDSVNVLSGDNEFTEILADFDDI